MSERPPRDPDDLSLGGLVEEVVSQVRGALDEADVTSRHSRDLLLDGLRDVMQTLDPGVLVGARAASSESEVPDVTVVDGGRAADAPPSEGPRPDLKVADPVSMGSSAEEDASEVPTPKVYTRVTVHTPSTPTSDGQPRVELDAASEGAPEWCSVFRGSIARPYRITAERGVVRISLNGLPADTVRAGSSVDVEARVIQVSAADAAATARYERLPS
jgi:hypothetical protein